MAIYLGRLGNLLGRGGCWPADEPTPHSTLQYGPVPVTKSSPRLFVWMVPLVHLIILVSHPRGRGLNRERLCFATLNRFSLP